MNEKDQLIFNSIAAGVEANRSHDYVMNIDRCIDDFAASMNQFKGYETSFQQLKGNIAEHWHANTFNIDAAVKGSKSTASVLGSNKLGSVDVAMSDGTEVGLKYMKDAYHSVKEQSENYLDRYMQYKSKNPQDTFSDYCLKKGLDEDLVMSDCLYSGQMRLIPSDQLKEAIEILKNKIAKEQVIRPHQVARYQETLDLLTDKLKSSDGIESISLSKAEAEKLAKLAKEGKYNPKECGFTTNELVKFEHIIKQGLKAGASAAAVALAISITQAIFQTASELHSNGYISDIDFKYFGLASAGTVGDSFIQASVTASLVTSCASGKLGATLQSLHPSVIGAAVIICINTVKDTIRMYQGKISGSELTTNIARNTAIVSATFAGGTLGANILTQMFASATQTIIPIPVIGYLIGSIIGSVIATYSCKLIGKKAISFCVDSGVTFFGLVEQDYVLPEHIIKEMGTEVLNYEKLKYDYISQERLEYDSLEYETLDYERCGIQRTGSQELSFIFIRRGVIGFNRIGYVAQ